MADAYNLEQAQGVSDTVRNQNLEQAQYVDDINIVIYDNWFDPTDSFDGRGTRSRKGWELIAIRNQDDTDRRGFYVNAKGHTVYVTVTSLDKIEVDSVKRDE
ncbi:hypothetical protein ACEPAF_766 [Sanghuangporus sanghuang]